MISDTALVSIAPRVGQVAPFHDGAIYVAALPEGPPRVLDGVAAVIWTHLEPPVTMAQLISVLADESGLRGEDIADDVRGFVDSLVTLRLACVSSPSVLTD